MLKTFLAHKIFNGFQNFKLSAVAGLFESESLKSEALDGFRDKIFSLFSRFHLVYKHLEAGSFITTIHCLE